MQENKTEPLIIGTRGSRLALWQAEEVKRLLPVESRLEIIRTSGDRIQDISLQGGSTTGCFTREIEERLMAGDIDLAVHSFKDLPTALDPRLAIAACLPRAPVTDLLLVHPDWLGDDDGLLPLKPGCRVGAGSLRRQALVRLYRPDAKPDLIRGNVPPVRMDVVLTRAVLEEAAEGHDPGVVHHHLDLVEVVEHLLAHLLHLCRGPHVQLVAAHVAFRVDLEGLLAHRLGALLAAHVGEGHVVAVAHRLQHDGSADTPGSPGDEEVHGSPFSPGDTAASEPG